MVRRIVVLATSVVALVAVAHEFGRKSWRRRWLASPEEVAPATLRFGWAV